VPGAPARLGIVAQPAAAVAGSDLSPGVVVDVQDDHGNRVHSATNLVTVALAPADADAQFTGTLSVAAVDGRATFDDLRIGKAGSYSIAASAQELVSASTTAFAVGAGAAFALAFQAQPSDVKAGAAMSPAVKVVVLDAFGNLASAASNTIALQFGANPGSGSMLGASAVDAAAGVATFSDVRINKASSGYTLMAGADGLVGATSSAFEVTSGAGASLGFVTHPANCAAGEPLAPTVQVAVFDAYGNVVVDEAHSVLLGVAKGPSGASLTGTATAATTAGVATFPGVSARKAGSGYVLGATSVGLDDAACLAFDVTPAAPSQLGFLVEPIDGVVGVPINPAVQIAVQDAFANTVVTSTQTVTVALDANTAGGTLTGTASMAAVQGVATFASLLLDKIGSDYTLAATAPSLTKATSAPFAMAAGSNQRLVFTAQPANAVAGATLAAVTVTVQDELGNVVTSATNPIVLAVSNNPGGSTMTGTLSAAPTAGVATFADLKLDKSGFGYTILATSTGVTAGVSAPFDVKAAEAAALAFVVQPGTVASGTAFAPSVQVAVRDAFGNVIPNATTAITVALATAPGAVLTGTATVPASAGQAAFPDLAVDKAGSGYTLVATATGLTTATSAAFQVTSGAPSRLHFTVQPGAGVAGAALAPAVKVVVEDAAGNLVSASTAPVTLTIATGPTGAALTGIPTASAVAGAATFSNLLLTRAGTGYTLMASSGSLTVATSTAFDIAPAAASRLVYAAQPSHTTAGVAIAPAVKLALQDAYGNTVPTSGVSVALVVGNNPGGTLLSGSSAQTVDGIAAFANIAIDRAATGVTLSASAPGVGSVTSAPFNVSAAAAARLTFNVQPSSATAGVAMSPAVKLLVEDQYGNTVTSATSAISLAVTESSVGAILLSGSTASAVAGVASFGNVSVDRVGSGLTLTATSPGLQAATSAAFSITAASAAKLAFSVQPASATAGAALSPDVKVVIQDAWGNTVTSANSQINLAIANNAGGGTLTGTLSAAAVSGTASFSNLHIDKAASGYTLSATSGSLTAATSTAFNIGFATAARLAFTVQPSSVTAGAVMSPAVKVVVQDAYGNLVTSSTATVGLALGANPGGSTLAASVDASAGTATFSAIALTKVGSGYTLVASGTGLTSATSSTFVVSFAAADRLAFSVQPSDVVAGVAIAPVVKVSVLDAYDNLVTTAGSAVTVTLAKNTGGATFTPATANASAGVASFANLSLDKVGTEYGLSASAQGLTAASSAAFAVLPATASRLAFQVQPTDGTAGAALPSFQVAVQDAFGNAVPTATSVVTLSVATNPGGASILAGPAATASGGIATFAATSLDKAASGYRFGATSSGLTGATSDVFAIGHGAAAKLAILVQPTDVAAGASMAAVKIAIQDTWGNTVTSASDSVSLQLSSNPTTATLGGATVDASAGIATFDGLWLDKVGSGYKIAASSGTLTSPASNAFAVTAGTAARLVFTVQPSDVVAGVNMAAVKVAVQDAFGNPVPGATHAITLGMGTNGGGASVLTGATAAAIGGVATFSSITLDKAGSGYTLTASASGLTGATSGTFAISPGVINKLAFSVQPTDVAAGKPMAAVKVLVQDAYGNTVPNAAQAVQLNIAVNPVGATLLTGAFANPTTGIATFDNVSLDKAGTAFKLGAMSSGLTGATSAVFNVTGGDPAKLAFTVQPVTTAADAVLPEVTVSVRDAWDNPLSTGSQSINLTLGPSANGGTLTGTLPVAAVSGVAHFTTLKVTKVAAGYTLTATSANLTSAVSQTFDITPGAPASLVFSKQPVNAQAGIAMTPSPTVSVLDAYGNAVTNATNTIMLAIGTNPSSGSLLDPATVAAVGGVATFDSVRLNKAGSGYTLAATSNGLVGATSSPFNLTYGNVNQLAFATQPVTTVAGTAIPNMTVHVLDAYGNLAASPAVAVTLDFATNPTGGVLSGGATLATSSNGVATFSGLKITKAGTGYQLSASASGPSSGTSSAFDITYAGAAKLAFTRQPTNASSGVPLSPAVEVTVLDTYGNKVANATHAVTVAMGANATGATLAGTKTINAIAGVASFADLWLDKVGSGYTLTATGSPLTGDTSSGFNVAVGTGKRLVFTTQPGALVAGMQFPSIVVQVQDTLGNLDTTSTIPVTVAIGTNAGGSSLSGVKSVNAVGGVATFSDLSLNKVGTGYTLSATSTAAGVTSGVSSPFNVTAASAAKLAFTTQPASSITAGGAVIPGSGQTLQVVVTDSFDNTVTGATNSVTLVLDTNSAGATLSGTTILNASGGTAAFSGALATKAGSTFRVVASASGLTSASSTYFDVLPAAANKLAFNVQPTKTVAGVAISPAVKVDVQDTFGNVVTTANDPVTLTVGGGVALTGGTASAVGGTATFSAAIITKAGTAYKLTATSGTLTSAVSSAFDVDPGTAAQLAIGIQPVTAVSGAAISPAVTVLVRDANDNTVPTSAASVSFAIGSAPNGGVLSGTMAMQAVSGVATFDNLRLDKAGTYTLYATSTGLSGVTTASFTVTAGAPSKLVFKTQPSNATAGGTLGNIQVEIRDAADNLCTTATNAIALVVKPGSGPGSLGGVTSGNAAAGVATLGSAGILLAGSAYVLTASSNALAPVDSAPFAVSASVASKLVYKVQPSGAVAGATLAGVQVEVRDGYDNVVTTPSAAISLSLSGGNAAAILTGGGAVTTVSGVATFSALSVDKAGTAYKLTASTTTSGVSTIQSTGFAITAGAPNAAHCALAAAPASQTADGNAQVTLTATIRDLYDNAVSGQAVTLSSNGSGHAITQPASTTSAAGQTSGTMTSTKAEAKTVTAYVGGATMASTTATFVAGMATKLVITQQPAATTSADAASIGTVKVELRDSNDNVVTTPAINVAIELLGGPGTIGTPTTSTVSGVATFSTLMVRAVGGAYKLSAFSGSLSPSLSSTFAITPGAAARLAFTTMPPTAVSGVALSPAPVVAVQDAYGNAVASTPPFQVGLALASNPPQGGTLSGGGVVSADPSTGVATWTSASLTKAGPYTFTATSGGLTSATSGTVMVSAGAPHHLTFTQSPAATSTADAATFGTVRVEIRDASDNLCTAATHNIAMDMLYHPQGTLIGSTLVAAVGGVATFNNLMVHKVGSGIALTASFPGLTSATSSGFAITPGAQAKLAFATQPASSYSADATSLGTIQIEVRDAYDNVCTSATNTITITQANGTGLTGAGSGNAVGGVVGFSGLADHTAGTAKALSVASSGMTATSTAYAVTFGAAKKVVFTNAPTTGTAGVVFGASSAPAVAVQDQYNNAVTNSTATLTLALAVWPSGGVISGGGDVTAASGVATWTGVSLNKIGGYAFSASASGLASATSGLVVISAGPATKLAFNTYPAATGLAADTWFWADVQLQDQNGNAATSAVSQTITVTANTLSGGPSQLANMDPCTIAAGSSVCITGGYQRVVGSYSLTATASGGLAATGAAFAVAAGPVAKLGFLESPAATGLTADSSNIGNVSVQLLDQWSNPTVSSSNVGVTITLSTYGTPGVLIGTATGVISAGAASWSFPGLDENIAGNYRLSADSSGLTSGATPLFAVAAGAPTAVAFVSAPTTVLAGTAMGTVTAEVRDQYGNPATTAPGAVTLSIASGPVGATLLSPTGSVALANGVATFSGANAIKLDKAGSYTLRLSYNAATFVTSAAFAVYASGATKLAVTQSPASTISADAANIGTVLVQVQDAYGNLVTSPSFTVGIALVSGTLSGTMSKTSASGIATFSNLDVNVVGTGYQLNASNAGLAPGLSTAFAITPGVAAKLALTYMPSAVTAGSPSLPLPTVTIQDAWSNTVTSSTDVVTMTVITKPVGATVSGDSATASGGVATFSGLSVDKTGTYTLRAVMGPLSSATSATFVASPGAASKLVFTTQPAATSTADATNIGSVSVEVRDANDNLVTTSTASITLALGGGAATLYGTNPVSAVSGVATFSNLDVNVAGSAYTLTANSDSLASGISSAFAITAGGATKLAWTSMPPTGVAGVYFTAAPTVAMQDQYGNTVTNAPANITLTMATWPNGATMTGGNATTASGVATFGSLWVNKSGAYKFTATSGSLTAPVTGTVTVSSNAANKLAFIQHPTTTFTTDAANIGTVKVEVRDVYDNLVANSTISIGMLCDAGNTMMYGVNQVPAVGGVATFSGLDVNALGAHTLKAFDVNGNYGYTLSNSFTVTYGAAAKLAFTQMPTSGWAGAYFTPVPKVTVQDAFGNTVSDSTVVVDLQVATGPSGGLLFGGSATAATGVATFAALYVFKSGNYTITASSGSLTTATSGTLAVASNSPASLVFTQGPAASVSADASDIGTVKVEVRDSYSNVVTGATDNITLSLANLTGTLTRAPTSGVATFPYLDLNVVGTGLQITASSVIAATSTTLTATSTAFDITPGAVSTGTLTTWNVTTPTNIADFVDQAGLQITVRDAYGNGVPNTSVTFGSSGSANAFDGSPATTSGANGIAWAYLRTTKAETKTVNAYVAGSSVASVEVVFVGGAPNTSVSTAVATPTTQVADGVATVDITVTIRDVYGNPVSGEALSFWSAQGAPTLTPSATTTDANGIATVSAKSTSVGVEQVIINVASTYFYANAITRTTASPQVLSLASPQTGGCQALTYTAQQANGVPIDVKFEYSTVLTDPFDYKPMTQAAGGDAGVHGVTASLAGISHTFMWNSTADVPHHTGPVFIRATPYLGTTAYAPTSNIQVLLYNGLAITSPGTAYAGPVNPYGTTLADLDNDGDLDVITANYSSASVTTFTNSGAGVLTLKGTYSEGSIIRYARTVVSADFNRDGKADVATGGSGGVGVFLGTGDGALAVVNFLAAGSSGRGIAAGDVDGDGDVDLVSLQYSTTVAGYYVHINNGTGTFTTPTMTALATASASGAALGDMNHDGKLDLVITNAVSNNGLTILIGSGTGTFTETYQIDCGSYVYGSPVIADVDRDGNLDIVVGSHTAGIKVARGTGNGSVYAIQTSPLSGNAYYSYATDVADFDGDGKLDVVVPDTYIDRIHVLSGIGDGTFTGEQIVDPATAYGSLYGVAAGDMNGDGRPDVVSVDNAGTAAALGVSVALNSTAYRCETSLGGTVDTAVGAGPSRVAIGDFNNDGKPDAAVLSIPALPATPTVSILLGTGNGGLTLATTLTTAQIGAAPVALVAFYKNAGTALDLAILDDALPGVRTLYGTGSGAFTTSSNYNFTALTPAVTPNTGTLRDLVAGDFDSDGDVDLQALMAKGVVRLTKVSASGFTMGATQTASLFTSATRFVTADVNLDGHLDLAVIDSAAGDFILLTNDIPTGAFAESAVAVNLLAPKTIATADFNNDGRPDFVVNVGSSVGYRRVYFGNGTASGYTYTSVNLAVGGDTVATGDFNGDGYIDIASSNSDATSPRLYVAPGTGSATFGTLSTYPGGTGVVELATADFNGDGRLDLGAVSNSGNLFSVLLSSGATAMQSSTVTLTGNEPWSLVGADFTNDGKLDLAVANEWASNLSILIGNGDGTLAAASPATVSTGSYPISACTGDFNGDGKQDIATADSSAGLISTRLGLGNGTFSSGLGSTTVYNNPRAIVAADFNRDGKLDVATANDYALNGFARFYQNNGTGGFAHYAGKTIAGNPGPFAIVSGDFNNDAWPDVAISNNLTNNVTVILMGSGWSTVMQTNIATCATPYGLDAAHMNKDGFLDLVVACRTSPGVISILLNTPATPGTAFTKIDVTTGDEYLGVVARDVTGDGNMDIIASGRTGHNLTVFRGNGGAVNGMASFGGLPLYPFGLVALDLNRDGIPDFAAANTTADAVTLMLGK